MEMIPGRTSCADTGAKTRRLPSAKETCRGRDEESSRGQMKPGKTPMVETSEDFPMAETSEDHPVVMDFENREKLVVRPAKLRLPASAASSLCRKLPDVCRRSN